jgi:ribosome modulation factor
MFFGKKKKAKAKKTDIHDTKGWVSPESLVSTDLPDAYHEGYDACLMWGMDSEENPYKDHTARAYWWLRGYSEAYDELK